MIENGMLPGRAPSGHPRPLLFKDDNDDEIFLRRRTMYVRLLKAFLENLKEAPYGTEKAQLFKRLSDDFSGTRVEVYKQACPDSFVDNCMMSVLAADELSNFIREFAHTVDARMKSLVLEWAGDGASAHVRGIKMCLESAIEVAGHYLARCEQELDPEEYRTITDAIR